MKVILYKVSRNMFQDSNDKTVKYCKFDVLVPVNTTADMIGSESRSYTTSYDNYDKIVDMYKKNVPVDLTLSYKKVFNSELYKETVSKINDIEL